MAMKGISTSYGWRRELVVGANQCSVAGNPPWSRLWKQPRWLRYSFQEGAAYSGANKGGNAGEYLSSLQGRGD